MDPDDIFLTDLLVHSAGTVHVRDYVENDEDEAFTEWVESAIAKGWVTRPDGATVSVTDAGRERFAEINQPVTYTSLDGKIERTFRRV